MRRDRPITSDVSITRASSVDREASQRLLDHRVAISRNRAFNGGECLGTLVITDCVSGGEFFPDCRL